MHSYHRKINIKTRAKCAAESHEQKYSEGDVVCDRWHENKHVISGIAYVVMNHVTLAPYNLHCRGA